MKKMICLIMIGLLIILSTGVSVCAENMEIPYENSVTQLRAGGGGSSGGGGGGGGGGSSTHSHTTSGRAPTLLESILEIIMLPFVLLSSSIVFYIRLTKRSRKAKKLMKQMMHSDGAWKFSHISAIVSDSFYAIQTAWANMDMTAAKEYLSNELYDSFQTKLNWMAYRNQKNVLEKITLLQALPVSVYDDADNTRDTVWFYIKGKMVDYMIDTNTHTKISGNTLSTTFVEYWQFTRKEDGWVLNKILQKDESDQIPFCE